MSARRKHPMKLDEHMLLLNGLQPIRRLRERGPLGSERPSKRQRTENLNSRYDRMIQTVNIMHPSPTHVSRSKDRYRVASSSSVTTNDTPRTPADAYSHRRSGSLGQEFSVIKMGGTRPSAKSSDPFDPAAFRSLLGSTDDAIQVLPPWLKGTISTLEIRNPLRLLLPDVAEQHDSDHSDIRSTIDITIASEREEVPFAFTSPTASSSALAARLGNTRLRPATTSFATNDWPSTTSKTLAGWGFEVQERHEDMTPLKPPFSTPGPASTPSLLTSPVLHRLPSLTPRVVPTTPQYGLDESLSFEFVPFTRPGPCSSTEEAARVPITTGLPYLLRQHSASSPVQDATSPALRLLESPLHILPFSTPGHIPPVKNTLLLSIDPKICCARSPALENIGLRTLLRPYNQEQQVSTPDLLYSSPASTKPPKKPSPPSPRSSSVEDILFILQDDALDVARPHYPLALKDQAEAAGANIDYNALDFKWERFDRGEIVADSTLASSPRLPHPGSEETFWSQPARRLPVFSTSARRQDDPGLDSSPASLRLTGVSTPLPASPHASRDHSNATKGALDQQEDRNPFAWIASHRHASPPSTPQSKKSSSRKTHRSLTSQRTAIQDRLPGPASERGAVKVGGEPRHQGQHQPGVSDVDGSGVQGPEALPPERRVPFAPCAGIYISPLQNGSDTGDEEGDMNGMHEEEVDSGQRIPQRANRSAARSTRDGLSTSEDRMQDTHRRRAVPASRSPVLREPSTTVIRQDGVPRSGTVEQRVSRSTINNSTQSGESRSGGEEDEIEEVEEDELEGCSQETRDTIESWTA